MFHVEPFSQVRQAPRKPIGRRGWTETQRTLYRLGIHCRDIAERSGVPLATVSRALSLRYAHNTSFGQVALTRATVELLLAEKGHATPNLWSEYDRSLYQTLGLEQAA